MARKAGNLFATAYLLLIFGIYPFYMDQGYVDIGKAKFHFFIYCSLGALLILAALGAVCGGGVIYRRIKMREPYLINWDSLSLTDILVMLYATEIFISYVYSDYRKEALWGTEGWYMGLVLMLVLCGLYFLISRFWDGGELVWQVGMAASGIVFLLGILDRFSFYLIPLKVREPSFISTLGNINWFCGYMSVIAPIGACWFLFREQGMPGGKERGKPKWLYGIYVFIAFMAGFCQGGNGVFLFFGALFYMVCWIAIQKGEWIAGSFLLLSLWGFSAQAVRVLRLVMPERYNYDTDNFCAYLTGSHVTLFVGIGALAGYLFFRFKGKGQINPKHQRVFHIIMAGTLVSGIFFWLSLSVIGTWWGFPGLGQTEGLLFDDSWGNGRGAAIYSGVRMYGQMPAIHKLLGVGPDCFSIYAYSLPEIGVYLRDNFGGSRLTNAHNELLTCLVNIGAVGVCLYLGIFLSFVKRCMRNGKKDPAFYCFAICSVCYFIYNMVSFAQVLNFPFLFLLLAMGEANRRRR